MGAAIRTHGLVKEFGSTRALDGLDLTVDTGEVHGFLGPNGSGKSTTVRILLGLLKADAGRVTVLGGDPWRDAVELHRRLAYVPSDTTLWPSLTGGEDALRLPEWARDLSPFAHLPQMPAAELTAGAPTVLILLAAALVTGGLVALRRLDVVAI